MKKYMLMLIVFLLMAAAVAWQLIFNTVNTVTRSRNQYAWTESTISAAANAYFWEQFHQGNRDSVPQMLEKLTAAYISNPRDIRTVTHLAFAHMWALSDQPGGSANPRLIEHATLAQKYFGESYRMNPADTRILSFLSSVKLVNGFICKDEGLARDGYFNGLKAIREWEDFSAFSLAYTLSRLPHTDDKFQKALQLMQTLAARYAVKFDPQSAATWRQIAAMELLADTHKSKDRVLYNSWVVPHNMEGFFMAYGDMLVKNGEWEKGVDVYRLSRYAKQYRTWDFKAVLEQRIANAAANVALFRKPAVPGKKPNINETILVQSGIGCRSCHQMSKADRAGDFAGFDTRRLLNKEFYLLK